jgi:histidine triad (HIT) family protein
MDLAAPTGHEQPDMEAELSSALGRSNLETRCVFCDRATRPRPSLPGFLYEDPHLLASLWPGEGDSSYLGQVMIQTRRHVPSLGELTREEGAALGALIQRFSTALRSTLGAELVYLECYMEVVRHVHLFLTPRYPGTPPEYWRGELTEWPGAPRGGAAEIDALGERLRGWLAEC